MRAPDGLFADLLAVAPWGQRRVRMYDRELDEPRLTAHWDVGGAGWPPHPLLGAMAASLSGRYGVAFTSVGANLYRDGRDSVAWHGDRIPREVVDPVVAIVSLGSPRRFLLRPVGGGASTRFVLAPGDLLVTGGTTQRTWQHCVPKVTAAGPRISVTFRHS